MLLLLILFCVGMFAGFLLRGEFNGRPSPKTQNPSPKAHVRFVYRGQTILIRWPAGERPGEMAICRAVGRHVGRIEDDCCRGNGEGIRD